jgi:hypothetical protein
MGKSQQGGTHQRLEQCAKTRWIITQQALVLRNLLGLSFSLSVHQDNAPTQMHLKVGLSYTYS